MPPWCAPGQQAIYYSPGYIGGQVDLRDKPSGVVTLYGEEPRSIFGIKAEVADVDGNGSADLLVGAFYADGPNRADAGKLYFFTGELLDEVLSGPGALDLAQPWPAGVGVAIGPEARSRLGVWMAAGDINGDGFVNVLIGAAAFGTLRNGYDHAGGAGDRPDNERPMSGKSTRSLAAPICR